jgi:hypothetical protein
MSNIIYFKEIFLGKTKKIRESGDSERKLVKQKKIMKSFLVEKSKATPKRRVDLGNDASP